MGERIFRPGIRKSKRLEQLIRTKGVGWMGAVFFDWLITVVDDYGRTDADPSLLRAEVFPLLLDVVRETDVSRCLTACEKAGLVRLYSVSDKPYLELLNFNQRLRAKKSRYPAPSDSAGQCQDNVRTMPTETETETETENPLPPAGAVSRFDEFWEAFPKIRRDGREACRKVWKSMNLDAIAAEVIAGLERWKASDDWTKDGGAYAKGTLAWLRAGKWAAYPIPAESNPGIVDMTADEAQRIWEEA